MKSAESFLRRMILVAFLLALTGSVAELWLIEHTEDFWQYIPMVLMVLSLVPLGLCVMQPRRATVRALQVFMFLFCLSGVAGLWLHYQANVEFELELYPDLSGFELFWKAIQGKSPPSLAPGMMFVLGILGWAYSHRRPR